MIELPHHHSDGGNTDKILEKLSQIEDFQAVSLLFKQLCDPTRLRIFWLLCHCEQCVVNIAALMDMTAPAISHHLRALRGSGLISGRRDGKEVYYRATDNLQAVTLHHMLERIMDITCPES